MLAFKDSVKKLTGVSFNPIKHENGAPNQVIGNHFADLNQHAALMLPYMQRCGYLLQRDKQMSQAESDELQKLQKLMVDSMEALSRSLYQVGLQFKGAQINATQT